MASNFVASSWQRVCSCCCFCFTPFVGCTYHCLVTVVRLARGFVLVTSLQPRCLLGWRFFFSIALFTVVCQWCDANMNICNQGFSVLISSAAFWCGQTWFCHKKYLQADAVARDWAGARWRCRDKGKSKLHWLNAFVCGVRQRNERNQGRPRCLTEIIEGEPKQGGSKDYITGDTAFISELR